MKIARKRTTFGFITKKRVYVLQISLKDPWILPKHIEHFSKADVNLYGWLFVYFGYYNGLP